MGQVVTVDAGQVVAAQVDADQVDMAGTARVVTDRVSAVSVVGLSAPGWAHSPIRQRTFGSSDNNGPARGM